MAFEPKFKHDSTNVRKAIGFDLETAKKIRLFELEEMRDVPTFSKVSEMLEHYWNRMPSDLKDEPFIMFYMGVFITKIINMAEMHNSIILN